MNGTLIKLGVILEQITWCRTNQIGNPMKVNIYLIHTINGIGIGILVYVVQGTIYDKIQVLLLNQPSA